MTDRQPPDGLGDSGTALWSAVTNVLDLDEHEAISLRELCRTADTLDKLQAFVDRDGHLAESSQGSARTPHSSSCVSNESSSPGSSRRCNYRRGSQRRSRAAHNRCSLRSGGPA